MHFIFGRACRTKKAILRVSGAALIVVENHHFFSLSNVLTELYYISFEKKPGLLIFFVGFFWETNFTDFREKRIDPLFREVGYDIDNFQKYLPREKSERFLFYFTRGLTRDTIHDGLSKCISFRLQRKNFEQWNNEAREWPNLRTEKIHRWNL